MLHCWLGLTLIITGRWPIFLLCASLGLLLLLDESTGAILVDHRRCRLVVHCRIETLIATLGSASQITLLRDFHSLMVGVSCSRWHPMWSFPRSKCRGHTSCRCRLIPNSLMLDRKYRVANIPLQWCYMIVCSLSFVLFQAALDRGPWSRDRRQTHHRLLIRRSLPRSRLQ